MLVLEKIVKSYNGVRVIDNLSITFPNKGFVGIEGKSGCGKSTLLNLISGLEKPDTGFVLFNNEFINEDFLRREISIISQNNDLLSSLNVKENILLGVKIASKDYDKNKLNQLINKLNLKEHLSKYSYQLSIGQIKRVSILRGIIKDSSILLCDEPTGALHYKQAKEVMELLKEVSKDQLVIIVSHDRLLLEEYCDEVLKLVDGNIQYKCIDSEMLRKEEKNKSYSLLFCILKRMIKDKYILMFMVIFEVIIIVSLFLMLSGMNGIEKRLNYDFMTSVDKNVLKLEQFNSQIFEGPLEDAYSHDYILSLGDISIDGDLEFLPKDCNHIELYEGRLPNNEYEIIVSYSYKENINKTIQYKYLQEDISLKIVGVLKDDFFHKTSIYFNNSFKTIIPEYINKNMLVYECDNSIEMYEKLSDEYIIYNDSIERRNSYIGLLEVARVVVYIFFSFSLLCSFFLFYIIYQTLGVKRKHDNALLLMLGLSTYKLFWLCLIEAVFIGWFIGFLGNFFSLVLYYYLNFVLDLESLLLFELSIDYRFFVFIFVLYVVLNVVSAYLPIKRIVNSNLVMMLREDE